MRAVPYVANKATKQAAEPSSHEWKPKASVAGKTTNGGEAKHQANQASCMYGWIYPNDIKKS